MFSAQHPKLSHALRVSSERIVLFLCPGSGKGIVQTQRNGDAYHMTIDDDEVVARAEELCPGPADKEA